MPIEEPESQNPAGKKQKEGEVFERNYENRFFMKTQEKDGIREEVALAAKMDALPTYKKFTNFGKKNRTMKQAI